MKSKGSVVVIDNNMRLCGFLNIHDALSARRKGQSVAAALTKDVSTVSPDTLISDIIPLAGEASVPIAVVDDNKALLGLVTKSRILASI